MKIAIINQVSSITENTINTGCGGSETWAIQLGNEFAKRGHCVAQFSNITTDLQNIALSDKHVTYLGLDCLQSYIRDVDADFMIISRSVTKDVYDTIKKSKSYKFLQGHDIYEYDHDDITYKEIDDYVDKIVCLTPYHAESRYMHCNNDLNKTVIIPNGIDPSLFEGLDTTKKDNRILWCSNPARGLYIILNYLYEPLKQIFPDFGIDIACPSYAANIVPELISDKDVRFLGSLPKEQLYKEMAKHKVWIYPQNFIDTFCIGMLENAMCNVNIVSPFLYGPRDIFGDIVGSLDMVINTKQFETKQFKPFEYVNCSDDDAQQCLQIMLNNTINIMQNFEDETLVRIRETFKQRVLNNYTWDKVALLYEQLYKNENMKNTILNK